MEDTSFFQPHNIPYLHFYTIGRDMHLECHPNITKIGCVIRLYYAVVIIDYDNHAKKRPWRTQFFSVL